MQPVLDSHNALNTRMQSCAPAPIPLAPMHVVRDRELALQPVLDPRARSSDATVITGDGVAPADSQLHAASQLPTAAQADAYGDEWLAAVQPLTLPLVPSIEPMPAEPQREGPKEASEASRALADAVAGGGSLQIVCCGHKGRGGVHCTWIKKNDVGAENRKDGYYNSHRSRAKASCDPEKWNASKLESHAYHDFGLLCLCRLHAMHSSSCY